VNEVARGAALALLLGLSGCGYALVGRGIAIDPSIKRIGVPIFKDSSGKVGLDQKITQKVIEELLKRHRFDVVQDATGVDAVVEGQITSYRADPIGFGAGTAGAATQASRYAVMVVAKVRYAKVGDKESIWEADAFSFRDEYDIGNAATFFDQEDQAIERLSTYFARSLVSAMLEAF
jgi:hypothetical protein